MKKTNETVITMEFKAKSNSQTVDGGFSSALGSTNKLGHKRVATDIFIHKIERFAWQTRFEHTDQVENARHDQHLLIDQNGVHYLVDRVTLFQNRNNARLRPLEHSGVDEERTNTCTVNVVQSIGSQLNAQTFGESDRSKFRRAIVHQLNTSGDTGQRSDRHDVPMISFSHVRQKRFARLAVSGKGEQSKKK